LTPSSFVSLLADRSRPSEPVSDAPFRQGLGPSHADPDGRAGSQGPPPAELTALEELRCAKAAADAATARQGAATARQEAATARLNEEAARLKEETGRAAAEATRLGAEADQLAALVGALEDARADAIAEVRAHAAAIILEAASHIAGDALHADPALLDALVNEGADALGREGLVVRVAPVDADALRARLPSLALVEDFSIAAGCVCVGPAGRIDASLGSAVSAVRAVLDRWRDGA
jgi:flagellar biosynthesis/type III secretory pathway protein FliH